MDSLTWILLGVLAYWALMVVLDRRQFLPEQVRLSGPILTIHTQRGRAFLDRLAQYRRFWRAWANIGVGITLVVMAAAFLFLVFSAVSILQDPQPTGVSQPQNVLVIPGVNDFLPLSVAPEIILGLLVGLVIHEGGHGILCRVERIEIDSMGVALLGFIPVGAFVQPDEESQRASDRGGRTRMFAAGVTNNFAITIVVFLLLFGPIAGSIGVASGAAVGTAFPESAAADAGLDRGDRIVGLNEQSVTSNEQFQTVLSNTTANTVTVGLANGSTVTVDRSLLVTSAVSAGPTGFAPGDTIVTVNGTPINTTAGLFDRITSERIELTTANGTVTTFPAGAFARVTPDGPLAEELPAGTDTVIVSIGETRVKTGTALSDALADYAPGDTVSLVAYVDGERHQLTVPLDGDGLLGVRVAPGISGVTVDDFGVQYYPADAYLALLGGNSGGSAVNSAITDSFIGKSLFTLFLPIAGIAGGDVLPYNFPGFTEDIRAFYELHGPLAGLGSGVFVIANALFWIGWLNINLGFFNCIPAFPLDGGHILRTSTEAIVSRLPITGSYELTKLVTISIGVTMFVSFLLIVFGPQLLG